MDFIAHIFYFYIFEKKELQAYFAHTGPIRIQTYLAWYVHKFKCLNVICIIRNSFI